MTNQKVLDLSAIVASLGDVQVDEGYEFGLLAVGAYANHVRVVNGMDEGYFYIVTLASRLRFPLFEFFIGVLINFSIAPF